MNFHVVTVFPEMIEQAARFGVVGQAIASGQIGLFTVNPRSFTTNVHQSVDSRPFGGGDGMVMLAEPLADALKSIHDKILGQAQSKKSEPELNFSQEGLAEVEVSAVKSARPFANSIRVVHFSPRGVPLTDAKVRELASLSDLILISSRYAGVDQRFLNTHVDEEISIGDYVLSGGELASLVLIDAVGRVLPGVLGNDVSSEAESFAGATGFLEHPQFARPREWAEQAVPEALLSGHHANIGVFQQALSILVTTERRPELIEARIKSADGSAHDLLAVRADLEAALETLESLSPVDFQVCGFSGAREALFGRIESWLAVLPERSRKRRKFSRQAKVMAAGQVNDLADVVTEELVAGGGAKKEKGKVTSK